MINGADIRPALLHSQACGELAEPVRSALTVISFMNVHEAIDVGNIDIRIIVIIAKKFRTLENKHEASRGETTFDAEKAVPTVSRRSPVPPNQGLLVATTTLSTPNASFHTSTFFSNPGIPSFTISTTAPA